MERQDLPASLVVCLYQRILVWKEFSSPFEVSVLLRPYHRGDRLHRCQQGISSLRNVEKLASERFSVNSPSHSRIPYPSEMAEKRRERERELTV